MIVRIELVNPFLNATFCGLEKLLGSEPGKGQISIQPAKSTCHQINVGFQVLGDVTGNVIFGMSLAAADRLASVKLGVPIKMFNAAAGAAIVDLVGGIAGAALAGLSQAGFACKVTSPTVIKGMAVEFTTLSLPAVVVPFGTSHGELTAYVALQPSVVAERRLAS